jgi:PTH1 family peptidyl-tRNA hydrolase
VGEAMRFFQLSPDDVVALHDELDLPPAKLRAKTGGGHAGHNGLRSIAAHIGADFHRIRLGIGHPGDKALVHRYVLDDFAKAEMPPVEALVEAVSRHAERLGARDFATFQNRVHLDLNPPPPKEPAKGAASAKAGEGKD